MGTHHEGSEEEIRGLDAFIKLTRAANTVTTRLARKLAEVELTASQFGILETLLHLGPLCQKELGEKLLTTGGNITTIVDNLERRELVKRVRSEEDRRFVAVHLTEEGRRYIGRIFPRHMRHIVESMQVLSPDELEELSRLCKKLGRGQPE